MPKPTRATDLLEETAAPAAAEAANPSAAELAAQDIAASLETPGTAPQGPSAGPVPQLSGPRTPGRPRKRFSPNRPKSELVAAGRELEREVETLRARLNLDGAPGADPAASLAEAPPAPPPDPATLEAPLAATFGVIFDLLASFRGPHWALADEQKEQLGKCWAPVAAEHVPDLGAHAPLVSAVFVTAAVVLPRIKQDREPTPSPSPSTPDAPRA